MDEDLEAMDRATLAAEIRKLRNAIRTHRDATVLAPSRYVGALAGTDKTVHCGATLAEIHARLHPLPRFARPAGAWRSHPRQGI